MNYLHYEWIVEDLDEQGEIINVEHFELTDFPHLPDALHDVALRRTNGELDPDGNDLGGDYSYAYMDADGNLSPTWDQTTERVPAKFKKYIKANKV